MLCISYSKIRIKLIGETWRQHQPDHLVNVSNKKRHPCVAPQNAGVCVRGDTSLASRFVPEMLRLQIVIRIVATLINQVVRLHTGAPSLEVHPSIARSCAASDLI
jgi:hypothetical protein